MIGQRRFRRAFHLHTVGHEPLAWLPRLAVPGRTLHQLRVTRRAMSSRPADDLPEHTPGSVTIRLLDVSRDGVRQVEPEDDFLLVDDDCAVRLVYDDHGRFAVAFPVPVAGLDRYRFIRDRAWAAARPAPPA